MDRIIKELLESLLQESSGTKRTGKRILNLAGFLSSGETPERIRTQLNSLSRLLVQQDAFDAILEPISLLARTGLTRPLDGEAIAPLSNSLEAIRKEITSIDDVNYAELTAWLVSLAQARKIIRVKQSN
ncbi:hypothetical protein [Stutzerimonas chloritidismutans]|uniref:hypothetical protein n=1 Tax=Stutzerimonas chloritidismutans TaxID=203192 RepID=UPI00384E275F